LIGIAQMLRRGAKVIRPTASTCRALAEVDLNLTIADYAQPYHGMGVVFPAEIARTPRDVLMLLWWRPGIGLFAAACKGGVDNPSLLLQGDLAQTIEEILDGPGSGELDREMRRLVRIGLNLALFAMERATLLPLSPKELARKKRAADDPRMARLAARDAQELVVQGLDLIIRETAPSAGDGPQGLYTQRTHRRRGHWKMQPCGPRMAERKRIYVASYLVNATADQRVDTVLS